MPIAAMSLTDSGWLQVITEQRQQLNDASRKLKATKSELQELSYVSPYAKNCNVSN